MQMEKNDGGNKWQPAEIKLHALRKLRQMQMPRRSSASAVQLMRALLEDVGPVSDAQSTRAESKTRVSEGQWMGEPSSHAALAPCPVLSACV